MTKVALDAVGTSTTLESNKSQPRKAGSMPPHARLLVALLVFAWAGCTSAKPITTPDGRQGYTVECSGSVLTWEDCFERADELCKGRNYDVYTQPGEESPLIASEPQHLRDNPTTHRSMVIACKGS